MRIDVVTLFPEALENSLNFGVTGRAIQSGLIQLKYWNPRDFAGDQRGTVDDRPFGGGPGMVMKATVLADTLQAVRSNVPALDKPSLVSYLSPQGRRFDQKAAKILVQRDQLILLCGRYEGIDERLIEHAVDEEWSIGDYVLSGGELAAAIMVDAIARLVPGVLGKQASAEQDSFMNGLLDCPHYTRPEQWLGEQVPAVLLTGDHAKIDAWRLKQALGRTWLRRPDLLAALTLNEQQQCLLNEFIEQYRHDE